ncbi:DUF1552 domain-containing protein [Alienimonas chondri]|uniref:DUF1552 domain-containing protein n=1 Tax=Alienimonas chondri TaxID=2681879 RepID=A0ABX1VDU4_9PLAN|nr:DUF1552 domain-containing protein [Alienimonas chondri]NNJ25442.1 hypothetical protein [Alienimonas chondri]
MSRVLPRRTVLRGAGAALALPLLDAMRPAIAKARGDESRATPRRMVAINVDLGFMPEAFFPEEAGRGYKLSPYLQPLAKHREDFTVFSGLSHPEVVGGHQTDQCFLTGAPHPRGAGFRNRISLDQYAAQHVGHTTRFPTLSLRVGPSNKTLSYTADGVAIPSEVVPSRVYRQLFVNGTPDQVRSQVRRLREGRSLMDSFEGEIGGLKRQVGGADRDRLDQYLTAVRDVERRLHASEQWEARPKPEVDAPPPKDDLDPTALVTRTRTMYDLARLAFETDSTRLITIFVTQQFNPKVDLPGVELPHHALTHQSQQRDSRTQLQAIETAQMAELARLVDGLSSVSEDGERLLDRTMVLQGSNLGHANRHDNTNLPMLLAGGGFRHGGHLTFDRKNNRPLCDLYVSMLQRMGVETDRFSSGSATLPGLDMS